MKHIHTLPLSLLLFTEVLSTGCSKSTSGYTSHPEILKDDFAPLTEAFHPESPPLPYEILLKRIWRDATRNDHFIDLEEAEILVAFTKGYYDRNVAAHQLLQELLDEDIEFSPEAFELLWSGDRMLYQEEVPLKNRLYEVQLGSQDFLFDDELLLRFDGYLEGSTGLRSHSRGYAAKTDGVLFKQHGSKAPHYESTHTHSDTQQLREQGPDIALDRAAEIYGLQLDRWNTFQAMSHDSNYYDPSDNTPYWAGICQGWTHNALDDRLSILVDVEGEENRKGLWIFGQWISRADLGNAMMGASYSLGIADSITIDSFVTPESWIKALAQHVLRSGRGLRVDIWNDEHNVTQTYNPQIWNQPIVEASIEVQSLPMNNQRDILEWARTHAEFGVNTQDFHSVKLVTATADWGAETNDSWEGSPLFKSSTWNFYMIANFEGRVVQSYQAFELTELSNLPTYTSDGLPDYIAIPKHELVDVALSNASHPLLNASNSEGARFRFLVGTVLALGIPDRTRSEFEAAFVSQGLSPIELSEEFPGIANAYSPEQWRKSFEERLGHGSRFGAQWGQYPHNE